MKQKILNWYNNETKKDKQELDIEKNEFIRKIKGMNKDEIVNQKPKKITLWERIRKVLINI
jgi:hypothetical protein